MYIFSPASHHHLTCYFTCGNEGITKNWLIAGLLISNVSCTYGTGSGLEVARPETDVEVSDIGVELFF